MTSGSSKRPGADGREGSRSEDGGRQRGGPGQPGCKGLLSFPFTGPGVLGKTDVVPGEAVNSCTDGYEGSSYGPLLRVTQLKPPAGLGLLTRMFGDECAAKSTRGAHQRK